MIAAISIEMLKFKKSKMLWVILVSSILIAGLSMVANERHGLRHYMFEGMALTSVMFGIILFSIYTAFIFTTEYTEGTVNTLFTSSVSRIKILASKLLIVLFAITLTSFATCLFITFFTGAAKGESICYAGKNGLQSILSSLSVVVICSLSQFALIPFMAFISMWRKSIVPVSIFSILIGVVNTVFIDRPLEAAFFSPWDSPGVLVFKIYERVAGRPVNNGIPGMTSSVIALIAIFVIGIIASIVYYEKSDVYLVK